MCVWCLSSMYAWHTSMYVWYSTKRGGNRRPLHDQMFLVSKVPLNFDRKLERMAKLAKIGSTWSFGLLININVHPANVKERGDQLDSWGANAWIFEFLCFFCFLFTQLLYPLHEINLYTHMLRGCFQICIWKRWSKCIFGQLCIRGAVVELFTLITFPLMLAACPNHLGSHPEP